ncbi:MAG: hypothetical protein K6347_01140 [Campylobacterales bacterium]
MSNKPTIHEPTLTDMDDYLNNESPRKRQIIWLIIAGLISLGAMISITKRAPSPQVAITQTLPR